ncbi:MAG: hypothetical protein CM1200mP29_06800 [Verrucomicrobiota bacterium]|nr:MAG: hypothetical protein CM1200mP29_06800 [Verrucomicrobiota bacterium]
MKSWSGRSPKRFTARQAAQDKRPVWPHKPSGANRLFVLMGRMMPSRFRIRCCTRRISPSSPWPTNREQRIEGDFFKLGKGGGSGTSLFMGQMGDTDPIVRRLQQTRATCRASTALWPNGDNSHDGVFTFQNGRQLASGGILPERKLCHHTPWAPRERSTANIGRGTSPS